MSIRNLLVVAEDAAGAMPRIQAAAALAERLQAHVDVLALTVQPTLDYGAAAGYGMTMIVDEVNRAREEAEQLASSLRRSLSDAGLAAEVRWASQSYAGIAVEVGRQGRYADLVVSGRSDDDDLGALLAKATDGALFDSGRPVALIPPGWSGGFGSRIVVAWDGSREAARAIGGAMPLIDQAEWVRIAIADPEASSGDGEEPGADLGEALARHNASVSVDRLPSMGHSVAETLTRHARDCGADLLVLGAYGHARLAEAIFGGVTREMLRGAPLPLLLAH